MIHLHEFKIQPYIKAKVFRCKRSTKTLLLFMLTGLVMIAVNKAVIDLATKTNSVIYDDVPYVIHAFNLTKIDWTDYQYLSQEANRTGKGEMGMPVMLGEEQLELSKTLANDYSYNVLVSDMISLDRSLPDVRNPVCKLKKYYSDLPLVSVVIVFHNEYLSVLLRTVHSVMNRSPPSLLKEVILVDDCSTKSNTKEPLDDHIRYNFPHKVRVVRLKQRSGLMNARMAGVQNATAEVVVIMDAHIEVNTGWLPPLLEPITDDYKTITLAIVDYIDAETFEYRSSGPHGYRGVLNWDMQYVLLPRRWHNEEHSADNYANPVMLGAFFAIDRKYFLDELGGYDDQLEIWGAEQFELSFKIWMCGGRMLTVPCTRVGHNFKGKGPHPFMTTSNGKTYMWKNIKRVAEVWMDDYKDVLYDKLPQVKEMNEMNVSKQKALRKKLNCKSFKWFLESIAPDILKTFPTKMPADFARGTIESMAVSGWCIDTLNGNQINPIGLFACAKNRTHPQENQDFSLSYFRDIRVKGQYRCWDANPYDLPPNENKIKITLNLCHTLQGNQFFRYDHINQMIYADDEGTRCVDADFSDPTKMPELFVTTCNDTALTQRWNWGFANETLLMKWDSYGELINGDD